MRLGNFGMFSQTLRFYTFCNLLNIWEVLSSFVLLSFKSIYCRGTEIGIIPVSLLIYLISSSKIGTDYKYIYSKWLDVKKCDFLQTCPQQWISRGISWVFRKKQINPLLAKDVYIHPPCILCATTVHASTAHQGRIYTSLAVGKK